MPEVRYHAAAEEELYEAIGFLELQARGLGRRLLREVRRTADRIVALPLLSAEIRPGIRKSKVRTFQYSLIYSVDDQGILILAVAHTRRRPDYWCERLGAH